MRPSRSFLRFHFGAPYPRSIRHGPASVWGVLDVVISRLPRLHGSDLQDIAEMVSRGLVDPQRLLERFESALGWWAMDARADDLPRVIRNFHRIQRDELLVEEPKIELAVCVLDV